MMTASPRFSPEKGIALSLNRRVIALLLKSGTMPPRYV